MTFSDVIKLCVIQEAIMISPVFGMSKQFKWLIQEWRELFSITIKNNVLLHHESWWRSLHHFKYYSNITPAVFQQHISADEQHIHYSSEIWIKFQYHLECIPALHDLCFNSTFKFVLVVHNWRYNSAVIVSAAH